LASNRAQLGLGTHSSGYYPERVELIIQEIIGILLGIEVNIQNTTAGQLVCSGPDCARVPSSYAAGEKDQVKKACDF